MTSGEDRKEIEEARCAPPGANVDEHSAWRPIETAPKGMKIIAGFFNPLGKWRTVMACFYPAGTLESDHADSGFAHEGWYEETEMHDELLCLGVPTHWQPLPAPPKETP